MIIISMEIQRSDRRFFVDTSAFMAMVYEKDSAHRAYKHTISLLGENPLNTFMTTDYILDETFTLLRSRAGLSVDAIEKFWDKILEVGIIVKFITKDDFVRAFSLIKKYKDHLLSFTDGTTASTMLHEGIHAILTTDSDFHIFGFETL